MFLQGVTVAAKKLAKEANLGESQMTLKVKNLEVDNLQNNL